MKTLVFIEYSYLVILAIWLTDSLSNALLTETEQGLSGKSRRDASINSYLHKSSCDGGKLLALLEQTFTKWVPFANLGTLFENFPEIWNLKC